MNKLNYIVTNNISANKDQPNDTIYNVPTFDTGIFKSSIGNRDPLPVVTVNL